MTTFTVPTNEKDYISIHFKKGANNKAVVMESAIDHGILHVKQYLDVPTLKELVSKLQFVLSAVDKEG